MLNPSQREAIARVNAELNNVGLPPYREAIQLADLKSVGELAAEHPRILTEKTLRYQLRHRAENGLADCCVAIGKKLLISKSRYEGWLATQAGKGRAAA